jgi:neutral trehalase
MMNALKLAKQLPFTHNFNSKLKSFLPVKSVIRNLGNTFYPRLIQIHQNLAEALVQNNVKYLKQTVIPELEEELVAIKAHYKTLGCRLKFNEPHKKLLTLKNYIVPETIFKT